MQTNSNNSIHVFFDTLGCAKNLCDTSKMEDILKSESCSIVDNAKDSDVIILNTCAFIEIAAQESIDTFFEYRNFYKDKKIIVVGCLCSRYKQDLKESLVEADAFVECKDEDDIYEVIKSLNISTDTALNCSNSGSKPQSFAYIKISEGCNKFCTYCTIPYIRGKYKSLSYDDISADCKKYLKLGVKEIILVAQDCGVWGKDFKDGKNLSWLLSKLCMDFPSLYFRLLYVQPDEIDNELLNTISKFNNICNYIDMPLQHCNSGILKKMNRNGSKEKYLNLINNIRYILGDCSIRTSFIVGFPGESEESFDELCDFVQNAQIDFAGIFEYSQEEGTKAALFDNQVSKDVKIARLNKLRDILDQISLQKIQDCIGNSYKILIDGFEDGRYFGRSQYCAPDVDGLVFISEYTDNNKKLQIGEFVNVKIVDTEGYDLVAICED